MALRRVGCGDLGMQECRNIHMQRYGDAGTWGDENRGFQGYGNEGCAHTPCDSSYPIAGVLVTPKLAPTSCCLPCLPLGLV